MELLLYVCCNQKCFEEYKCKCTLLLWDYTRTVSVVEFFEDVSHYTI